MGGDVALLELAAERMKIGVKVMDGPKQLFRIVIGAFQEPALAASARQDLRRGGLSDTQLCVIGKRAAAAGEAAKRQLADEVVEVTAPALFDQVWQEAASTGQPIAPWMTKAQSKAILDSIRGGALVLMVSAASATEQVRASQIQLNHHPSMVQAYSFTA